MSTENVTKASRFLSLVLRHKPQTIGIALDPEGWADVDELVEKSKGRLTVSLVIRAVAENDKQRFTLETLPDGTRRIRARQGHTVEVDLKLKPKTPPLTLFHGTYPNVRAVIEQEGLKKMKRQHVHLAADLGTASSVGMRRGAPVIFEISALEMSLDGYEFFQADNGVWLTDHVPPKYLMMRE